MSVASWIGLIGNIVVGFLAGVGAAAFLMQRKLWREIGQMKGDIDQMYIGHGLKGPCLERFLDEHPDVRAAWEYRAEAETPTGEVALPPPDPNLN